MMSRRVVASFLKKVHAAQQPKQAAFSTYKTSTGLVGLAVDENGRQNLINISTQILESVKVIGLPKIEISILSHDTHSSLLRLFFHLWITRKSQKAVGTV